MPHNEIILPDKFNLIYHLAPLRVNEVWRHNLDQLCQPHRWRLFNGRRIIAVATGDKLDPISRVREEFATRNCRDAEFIEVPNDVRLREVASFRTLLERVQSQREREATFYAHSKGNSTTDNAKGAWAWTLAMYRRLLDEPEIIRDLLRTHAFVGACKMTWDRNARSPYPTKLNVGNWMLAGTFYWFNHNKVFSRESWSSIPDDRYAAEAWPSIACPDDTEGATVYQPWPVNTLPIGSPYDPTWHQGRQSR